MYFGKDAIDNAFNGMIKELKQLKQNLINLLL